MSASRISTATIPRVIKLATLSLLAAVPILAPAQAAAQSRHTENTITLDAGTVSPPATIEQFAFLRGLWVGEGLGGEVDEMWSRPNAGSMAGAFRLVREGRVIFYEMLAMEQHGETVVLRLKHLDPGPGLRSWEERDGETAFRLVRVASGVAWFHGLTFRLVDANTLSIHLALRNAEGVVREEEFRLKRAAP